MTDQYLKINGIIVPASDLEIPRARELAETASSPRFPFVRLVECLVQTQGEFARRLETIVLDLDIERPQKCTNDIQKTERVAITFDTTDRFPPEVLALRSDFPWVPHVNLRHQEFPRSLCLYDRPWAEISTRWTPILFVERIRYWLAATAKGKLHQEDQPLEPLLMHSGWRIILPADMYEHLGTNAQIQLDVVLAFASTDCKTLFAFHHDKDHPSKGLKFVAYAYEATTQTHGLIQRTPKNLDDLNSFLSAGGIDLVDSLRRQLVEIKDDKLLNAHLAIVVALPLIRNEGSPIEKWDFWVFATEDSVLEIGTQIGIWAKNNHGVGLLVPPDTALDGNKLRLDVLSPYLAFSDTAAATANGTKANPMKTVSVGAGAIGSQVVTNLARSGFGNWTIVDEDDLLPHNLARHALTGDYVGVPKATGLAHYLNTIYPGQAVGIVSDVLNPTEEEQKLLGDAFENAELIVDLSASTNVARYLSIDVQSKARRVSVFLNPMGTDLVVIAEDEKRTCPLDELEAQYYRAVVTNLELKDHLTVNGSRLRYGRSCRDISSRMSTGLVSTLSSLATDAIRMAIASPNASIRILRSNPETLEVKAVELELGKCANIECLGWRIVLDRNFQITLSALREAKLPNETGGVLIGHYDLDRKTVYVVDTIPSPPDSQEWPTLYIRGSEGLLKSIDQIGLKSAGQLEYVGEWHSHPNGCDTSPSADDLTVYAWLTEHLSLAGLPSLMAIVGQNNSSSWYIAEMVKDSQRTVTY